MKVHDIVEGTIHYPTGEYMERNILIILSMIAAMHKIIDEYYHAAKELKILCRGSSGAIIAALVAHNFSMNTKLKVSILHIKKEGEQSHSHNHFDMRETYLDSVVVIVDDIVCTGDTVEQILDYGSNDTLGLYPHILCVTGDIAPSVLNNFKFEHLIKTN